MKTLLITPPFSQLNTPYPATQYLTSFLDMRGFNVTQRDIGIKVINRIFSKDGLKRIILDDDSNRVELLKESYINKIEPVMDFLKGKTPTLAYQINSDNYLPISGRFDNSEEEFYSRFDIQDRARYRATLFLNDISDYISEFIDRDFGFSRYSEKLGISQSSFKNIEEKLQNHKTVITDIIREVWQEVLKEDEWDNIGITIPFPGNLIPGLILADEAKRVNPDIKIFIGGGWVNTELRRLEDKTIFNYVDYILLDDGEAPAERVLNFLKGGEDSALLRTFCLKNDRVEFIKGQDIRDYKTDELPAPTYRGLDLDDYISIIDSTNPMHSLWNNGRWNKLTLAHGCYWKKCAFCDITLPYIRDFHQSSAEKILDKIEALIEETGERGFHFVDEAAPPALLKELAKGILRRGLSVTWWTNIRFEQNFTRGVALLLAKSGCIGVSGGVEVASDRLLKQMNKGVSVEQVTTVTANLSMAGIMVHSYLMYGFPSQTIEETIDALEVVRQLFKEGLINSAYWHQFSLTAHSRVGENPDEFGVEITGPEHRGFAENDLEYSGNDYDPGIFTKGLKTSLYNYMRGNGFDLPLYKWFDFRTPKPRVKKGYITSLLEDISIDLKDSTQIVWTGERVFYKSGHLYLVDNMSQESMELDKREANFILKLLDLCSVKSNKTVTIKDLDPLSQEYGVDIDYWLSNEVASTLYEYGLILI